MKGIVRQRTTRFPRKKINSFVRRVLPKRHDFRVQVIDSEFGNMKIVRVVTPAWKSKSPADRIRRVLKAAQEGLTQQEQDRILRFSVLTEEELRELQS